MGSVLPAALAYVCAMVSIFLCPSGIEFVNCLKSPTVEIDSGTNFGFSMLDSNKLSMESLVTQTEQWQVNPRPAKNFWNIFIASKKK
ncbi:unnamed protein product [Haemonchus placei]|uniref:Uncharacterized protein n=1 Tax=Haemonchus placei TaxID=6290 RepID=A0A3P7T981_HAEPC|nr:unnamed protein product [Haemonchus placei]